MAKFYGKIGFLKTVEKEGSVWEEEKVERCYYGDIIRHSFRYESSGNMNDDVKLNNEISIVADDFAYQNCHLMKYVELNGCLWKISSITVDRPRITVSIGGVWTSE